MDENRQVEIYEEYYPKVRSYILGQVNNYHLAEDLCSDVFVKIYEKLDTYDDTKSSISTWVFTIARNKLIDYYRTNKVSYELTEDIPYQEEKDDGLCCEENLEKLTKSLKQLEERERNIIILHYYHKMTLKEIGTKLGISYTYVKILHAKALVQLKDFMI